MDTDEAEKERLLCDIPYDLLEDMHRSYLKLNEIMTKTRFRNCEYELCTNDTKKKHKNKAYVLNNNIVKCFYDIVDLFNLDKPESFTGRIMNVNFLSSHDNGETDNYPQETNEHRNVENDENNG